MLFKGKNKFIFILSIFFIIMYTFIAVRNTGHEIHLIPIWAAEINEEHTSAENADGGIEEKNFEGKKTFLFTAEKRFGFFSEDGTILRTENFNERMSASSVFWTKYSNKPLSADIYSPEGKKLLTVNSPGYVHLDKDRIYLFEPGGNSVCKYDIHGNKIWKYAHTAVITAFNCSSEGTVIGYSDGKFVCLDNSGNTVFSFFPGGSKYQIILGAAISEDGKKAVCICGAEKQRLILINITGSHYKIVHHTYLKNNSYKRLFINFDLTGNFAVFESADGIGIADFKKLKTIFLNENGNIADIGSNSKTGLLTVLLQNEKECTLIAINPPDFIIGKTKFNSKHVFLIQDEDKIYLGTDTKITALEIRGIK
ncbi:hypothetical protein TPE_2219 [Treponema pedis str. T A4]|uniref:Uncharacterized protein n=2 Tax=Treponema pedis TaxID=409322 RepID=S6A1I2_9SPIR|nr:hypothetical protein TPE_2219 [Treponema pedis str. T A4]